MRYIVLALMNFVFVLPVVGQQRAGGVGIVEVGVPHRDANESGDREFFEFGLLKDDKKHEYGVLIDVTESMTPAQKAAAIKDAIEADPNLNDKIDVQRAGHVLTMEAKAPYEGVRSVGTKNRSRETGNRARVSYPPQIPTLQVLAATSVDLGRVIMFGAVPDTGGYVIQVGTNRWLGIWDPSQFQSVADMVKQIHSDLAAHGISVALENPWSLRVVLDPDLDVTLHYGNSAPDIEQWAWVGDDG